MEYENHYEQTQRPKYDCLLFDLDDTLYPFNSGMDTLCRKNIEDYMVEKLGIEKSKIADLCNLLYKNYGTILAGLRAIGYDFDYDEYYSFVDGGLPYESLQPDPVLRNLLLSLPIRKVIFTNANKIHTVKALSRLGLEDCFEGVICFDTLNSTNKTTPSDATATSTVATTTSNSPEIFDIIGHFAQANAGSELPKTPIVCKPQEDAIELALRIANINPQRTLFFEDSVRNVQSGKRVGFHTVLLFFEDSVHNVQSGKRVGLHTVLLFFEDSVHNVQFGKRVGLHTVLLFFEDSVHNVQSGKRVGLHTVLVGTSQKIEGADYALESIHNIREALPELSSRRATKWQKLITLARFR